MRNFLEPQSSDESSEIDRIDKESPGRFVGFKIPIIVH